MQKKNIKSDASTRYFFDQVGHQTTYVSIGNKPFFIKSCHCQTYQDNEPTKIRHIFYTIKYFNNETFKNKLFVKIGLLVKYSSQKKNSERFHWFLMLKNDFESQNFAIFEEVVHNFGRSDDNMI